jgi:hypothetical protein
MTYNSQISLLQAICREPFAVSHLPKRLVKMLKSSKTFRQTICVPFDSDGEGSRFC